MRAYLLKRAAKYYISKKAMSVIEVMVSFIILGVLLSILLFFFKTGSDAWRHSSKSVDLENNALLALTRMEGDIRETAKESITIETINPSLSNDSICFLSMVDDTTRSGTYNGTNPDWKKYIIYFLVYDPDNSTVDYDSFKLCQREVLLDHTDYHNPYYPSQTIDNLQYHPSFPPAGQTTGNSPSFFISLIPDTHTTENRVISRYITSLSFSFDALCSNKVINIELQAKKKSERDNEVPKEVKLNNSIFFRN